ncbi:MAG: DUF4123 domain-containing protein [Aquabacterium sp.]|uniref:DUF4123 domain-containing protein n=1 Tax=Aquabacterium sp. TaxID=1872578 RepID=UPI003BAF40C9
MSSFSDPLHHQLWATPEVRVYAFLQGHALPGVAQQLEQAEREGGLRAWDCLLRGALPAEARAQAPWIAELQAGSAFTQQVLRQWPATFPAWGLLGLSHEPMLSVRERARRLMRVGLPQGDAAGWRWLDPALWGALLPRLQPHQLDVAFAGMRAWVLLTQEGVLWLSLRDGVLAQDLRPLPPLAG